MEKRKILIIINPQEDYVERCGHENARILAEGIRSENGISIVVVMLRWRKRTLPHGTMCMEYSNGSAVAQEIYDAINEKDCEKVFMTYGGTKYFDNKQFTSDFNIMSDFLARISPYNASEIVMCGLGREDVFEAGRELVKRTGVPVNHLKCTK